MDEALELLIQEGLFKEKDEDGEEQDVVYERHDLLVRLLVRKADELVEQQKGGGHTSANPQPTGVNDGRVPWRPAR